MRPTSVLALLLYALVLIIAVQCGFRANGPEPTQDAERTAYEPITNFDAATAIVSVTNGLWSSPATWSLGRVPTNGDVVAIASAVTLDGARLERLQSVVIRAGGQLSFQTNINTSLMVANLQVDEGGELIVGTAAIPVAANVTARIVFLDQPLDLVMDPLQFGNGLVAQGKVTMHGSPRTPTIIRLAQEPQVGHTVLALSEPSIGWAVGDKLILPDTHQLDWFENHVNIQNYRPQWEVVTIASLSADRRSITLTSPLAHAHRGARNLAGVLEFLPHVGNVSRNVIVKSESNQGVRGHTLFTHRAEVDIRYVQFSSLGRTRNGADNDTILNAQGVPTHLGTNQSGRYPVNFRHLIGPAATSAYQFTFTGNSVFCGLNNHPFRWGISIKNSHHGLVSENVIYNWAGAGFVTEDGNESYNVFEKNFVVRVGGTGVRETRGEAGDCYWFRGPFNYIWHNTASNCYGGGNSWGFDFNVKDVGYVKVPTSRGADIALGQFFWADANGVPLFAFTGNEVYGATPGGLTIWHMGIHYHQPRGAAGVIKDFRVWHVYEAGYLAYETSNLMFDGFVVRGDTTVSNWLRNGFTFGDYFTVGLWIANADVQGASIGFEGPYLSSGVSVIETSYFRNRVNISIPIMWTVAGGHGLPAKSTLINYVRFDAPPGHALSAIRMNYNPGAGSNVVQQDVVYVYNHNQVWGDNFRLYYNEQIPDFIVPQTGQGQQPGEHPVVGYPAFGLTNQQNMDYYGLAIAGGIAPPTAVPRLGIHGLAEPF